jgi:hypothetical protein
MKRMIAAALLGACLGVVATSFPQESPSTQLPSKCEMELTRLRGLVSNQALLEQGQFKVLEKLLETQEHASERTFEMLSLTNSNLSAIEQSLDELKKRDLLGKIIHCH